MIKKTNIWQEIGGHFSIKALITGTRHYVSEPEFAYCTKIDLQVVKRGGKKPQEYTISRPFLSIEKNMDKKYSSFVVIFQTMFQGTLVAVDILLKIKLVCWMY